MFEDSDCHPTFKYLHSEAFWTARNTRSNKRNWHNATIWTIRARTVLLSTLEYPGAEAILFFGIATATQNHNIWKSAWGDASRNEYTHNHQHWPPKKWNACWPSWSPTRPQHPHSPGNVSQELELQHEYIECLWKYNAMHKNHLTEQQNGIRSSLRFIQLKCVCLWVQVSKRKIIHNPAPQRLKCYCQNIVWIITTGCNE